MAWLTEHDTRCGQRRRIPLLEVVDNQTDKNVANIAARGVRGAFGAENELIVDSER